MDKHVLNIAFDYAKYKLNKNGFYAIIYLSIHLKNIEL